MASFKCTHVAELGIYGPEFDPLLHQLKSKARAKPTTCKSMSFQYGYGSPVSRVDDVENNV
jgi:hypothetical protein